MDSMYTTLPGSKPALCYMELIISLHLYKFSQCCVQSGKCRELLNTYNTDEVHKYSSLTFYPGFLNVLKLQRNIYLQTFAFEVVYNLSHIYHSHK